MNLEPKGRWTMRFFLVALLVGGVAAFTGLRNSGSADQMTVGKAVPAAQQVSMDQIDHSDWNTLLQKYVNDAGQINYKAWKASEADSAALDAYLNNLSTASTSTEATAQSQLAFWINAYNAVTVKGILQVYPTTSIRNHTAKVVGYNIWKDLLLIVGDSQISLDSMEHKVLREMGEPRIHFAIVCASHSCPRLLNQAYTANALDEQLTLNTKNFFANAENFQHDAQRQRFRMSSIMSWFAQDFGQNQAAQLATIAPYLPTREAYDAAVNNRVGVSYLEYDWSLNEQKEEAQPSRRQGSGSR